MLFARSQIADVTTWNHIVFQFNVFAEIGENCLIPSFKIAQLAPFPGQGGVMHLLMSYTRARALSFVGSLPPPRREVVPIIALTALIKRLQLWFVDSHETSRAGLVAIASIPLLGTCLTG